MLFSSLIIEVALKATLKSTFTLIGYSELEIKASDENDRLWQEMTD